VLTHEFLKCVVFPPSTRCLKCCDHGGVLQGGDAQSGCDDTHMRFMDTVRVTPFKKIEIKGKGEMNIWNLVQDVSLPPSTSLFESVQIDCVFSHHHPGLCRAPLADFLCGWVDGWMGGWEKSCQYISL
jgi:hypothetical protein